MIYNAEGQFKSRERVILKNLREVSTLPFEVYQRNMADMHEGLIFVREGEKEFVALFDGDVQFFDKSHDGSYMLRT